MPKAIATLAKRYQRDALRIEVAGGKRGHVDIEYRAIRIAPNEAEHAVVNLLRLIEAPIAIVFCNTREAVRHLHATLLERGFSAVLLSGELSQHERNQAMQALRNGRARVCVATDVAARGIDLPNVGIVIHADLPHDVETMQHRSGRTGRAGRKGVSALLVPIARRRRAEQFFAQAGLHPIWSGAAVGRRNPPARSGAPAGGSAADRSGDGRRHRDGQAAAGAAKRGGHRRRAAAHLPRAAARARGNLRARRKSRSAASRAQRRRRRADSDKPPERKAREFGKRACVGRRRQGRVVQARHRPREKRRSQMAAADDLPRRRPHQAGYRRDPHFRPRNEIRSGGGGRRRNSPATSAAAPPKTSASSGSKRATPRQARTGAPRALARRITAPGRWERRSGWRRRKARGLHAAAVARRRLIARNEISRPASSSHSV